jgi:hypothetical protein
MHSRLEPVTVTRRARLFAVAAVGLSLLVTSPTFAMPTFPAEIQAHLKLNYTPPCTFCHATQQGGGPVTTKFALSMQAAGLTSNIATLDPALDKLNADHTDSDGDGTPDIQQIEMGLDPSTGAAPGPTERYGCGARMAVSPVRSKDSFVLALCAMGLVAAARARHKIRGTQSRAGSGPRAPTR